MRCFDLLEEGNFCPEEIIGNEDGEVFEIRGVYEREGIEIPAILWVQVRERFEEEPTFEELNRVEWVDHDIYSIDGDPVIDEILSLLVRGEVESAKKVLGEIEQKKNEKGGQK